MPDDAYVVMPNQLGIDYFDIEDGLGQQKDFMCSADLAGIYREKIIWIFLWTAILIQEMLLAAMMILIMCIIRLVHGIWSVI